MNEIRRSININANPFDLFDKWYEEAKIREINDPNAMNLATVDKNLITVRGLVASLDGKTIYKLEKIGPVSEAVNIGHNLGSELLEMGADKILKSVTQ